MDTKFLEKYSAVILAVIFIILSFSLFVTPERLEREHRLILEDIAEKYPTKSEVNSLQVQLQQMQFKLDKIYDYIMAERNKK